MVVDFVCVCFLSFDGELFSFEIRSSLDAIDAILGKTSPDDILNHIFATMCVGK